MKTRSIGLVVVVALLLLVMALPIVVGAGEQMERICIYCRDTSKFVFGGDLIFYSDEASTQKLKIEGSTGDIDSEGDGDFADNLTVGGDASVTGGLTVAGAQTFAGAFTVNNNATFTGTVTLNDGAKLDTQSGTGEGVVFVATLAMTYGLTTTSSITIPANADVVDWALIVTEAYTDTGTDLMNCGWVSDTDKFIDDLSVAAAGRNMALDAADTQQDEAANWGDVGSSAIGVYCVYTGENGDAAAGASRFIIWWRLD